MLPNANTSPVMKPITNLSQPDDILLETPQPQSEHLPIHLVHLALLFPGTELQATNACVLRGVPSPCVRGCCPPALDLLLLFPNLVMLFAPGLHSVASSGSLPAGPLCFRCVMSLLHFRCPVHMFPSKFLSQSCVLPLDAGLDMQTTISVDGMGGLVRG